MKFSIVIPAFNEEKSIAAVIEKILEVSSRIKASLPEVEEVELIVVNDGSSDDTAKIASSYEEVILINCQKNYGYGAALKCGFEKASGEILSFLDVDCTYPPEELLGLCRKLLDKNLDMVVGSRLAGGRKQMSWVRFLGNKLFVALLSLLTHRKITDVASGMWVLKKSAFWRLMPLPDGLNFTLVLTLKAMFEGLKIIDVPIAYRKRVGASKLNIFRDGFIFLSSIFQVAETYRPLKFFGIAGLILIVIAASYSIHPLIFYLRQHIIPEGLIYRLLSILVMMNIGLIALSVGILSNYMIFLIRYKRIEQTKLNDLLYNKLMTKISPLGIILVFFGVILNYKTIYQYITTGQVMVHWAYIVAGAFLVLTGAIFYMLGTLARIMRALNEVLNKK